MKLRHAIKIHAPRDRVFEALTDVAQVAAWHLGHAEGKIAVGSVLSLTPKPGLKFGWETKEIVKDERLAQSCVEGPGNSVGKNLVFTLPDAAGGVTVMHLTDGDCVDVDPHLPFCNAHWGEALNWLKRYVEKGQA
jgi:uncharacterized protein YndB with AHSA1/START domain